MKKFLLLMICLGFQLTAFSQETPERLSLTVEDAVRLALENNLGVKIEDNKVQVLRRNRDFVWNQFLPSLTVGATLSRINEEQKITSFVPIPTPPFLVTQTIEVNPWNLGLSFQAQLPLTIAMFRGIEQTVIEYENGQLSAFIAARRLERDVRKFFNQILALEESVKITALRVENARQRFLQAEASFRSGRIPEINSLQAKVSWENTKPALRDQELTLENLKMTFKMLLGLPLDKEVSLSGTIEAVDFTVAIDSENLNRLIDRRLDVLNMSASAKALENAINIQYDLLYPTLILMLSMDPSLNDPFNSEAWTKDGAWKQRGGMVGISLSWKLDSLIPGNKSWVNIKNMEDQLQQLRLTEAQLRMAGAVELINLLKRIEKSRESLGPLQANVDLAQRAARLANDGYRAGNQSLLEVQDAELQLQTARLQLLNEKINLNNSIIDFIFALDQREGEKP